MAITLSIQTYGDLANRQPHLHALVCAGVFRAQGRFIPLALPPADTAGVARLCRYLVHPPIALGRLTYDGVRAGYRGRRVHPVTGQESVTLDPVEMLARLCQHIQPPGFHLTRLYGAYANRTRGARAQQGAGAAERTKDREFYRAPAGVSCAVGSERATGRIVA